MYQRLYVKIFRKDRAFDLVCYRSVTIAVIILVSPGPNDSGRLIRFDNQHGGPWICIRSAVYCIAEETAGRGDGGHGLKKVLFNDPLRALQIVEASNIGLRAQKDNSHPENNNPQTRDKHHSHIISNTENVPQTPQTTRSKEDSHSAFSFPCPSPVKACTSSIEEPLAVDPVGVGNAKRPVPISNVAPPAARLAVFPPERVTPAAPALRVFPSTMTMEEDSALTLKPSISKSNDRNVGGGVVESGIVLEPMSKIPDGWRLITVPSTVAADPPAEMMVLAIGNAEGFGVKVWLAAV